MVNKSVSKVSNKYVYIFSVVAAFCLIITNSALWVNRYFFNNENFTNIATNAISEESSRKAIASGITNEIFSDRPVAKQFLSDKSENLIAGLLDTEAFRSATNELVSKTQTYVSSAEQETISLDLSRVNNSISKLIEVTNLDSNQNIENISIPDQIVIINEEDFPDLYNYSVVMLWLGPIVLIGAIIAIWYPYYKYRPKKFEPILIKQSVVLLIGMGVALLIGPLFKPIVISGIKTSQGRVVVENLYTAFISTFNSQILWIALLIFLILLFGIWRLYLSPKKSIN